MGNYFNFQSRNYYDTDLNLKLLANQNKWQGQVEKSVENDKMDTETFFNGKTSDGTEVGKFLCKTAKLPLPTKETKEKNTRIISEIQEEIKEFGNDYYEQNNEDSLAVQSAKGAGAYCLAVGKSFEQLLFGLLQLGNKVLPTKEDGILDTVKGAKEIGIGLKDAVFHPYNTFVKPVEETWEKNPSAGLGEAYGLLFQTAIGAKGAANGIKAGAKVIGKNAPKVMDKVEVMLVKNRIKVPQKYIDAIKKERPHLSPELQEIYAQRLMRAEKTGSPWEIGPLDDYERALFQKFMNTKSGGEDLISNIRKIVKDTDVHIPRKTRKVSFEEFNALKKQFDDGSWMGEDKKQLIYQMFKNSEPLDRDCVVYRGVVARGNSLENNAFLNSLREGKEITCAGWTSTAPEYSHSVHMFHPSNLNGKGYMMRIKLPKGTKGIDYRAIEAPNGNLLMNGSQNEFLLPPNSRIKINKIDYANQIIECEYVLPEVEDFIPNPKFNMKPVEKIECSSRPVEIGGQEYRKRVVDIDGQRKIQSVVDHNGNVLNKRDVTHNSNGTTTEVTTEQVGKYQRKFIKTVTDENGKVISKKIIRD